VVVIRQKSEMDCGVAALQAMLAGYGISSDYEQLRTRLKTDETGTNLGEMKEAAAHYGLRTSLLIVPAEQVFVPEAELLPAIVIITNGTDNHMLLLWRFDGDQIEALDPAKGKALLQPTDIKRQLLVRDREMPAEAYHAWACGEDLLTILQWRLRDTGLSKGQVTALQQKACQASDWNHIAILDAKTRMLSGTPKGWLASQLLSLLSDPSSSPEIDEYRFAHAAPLHESGALQVYTRGTILLTALGKK
jgi:hypothetical protein